MGMGGRGRSKNGRSNRGANRKPQGDRDAEQADWTGSEQMHNPRFEAYYKGQGLLPFEPSAQYAGNEGEWGSFWSALKDPLPTTFRITNGRTFASQVQSALRDDLIPSLAGVEFEGTVVPSPEPISWYPKSLAWQFDVHRQAVRKEPHFKALQRWLVHETETGSISRQEAVSMLPPLFLNAQHDHLTLDMCAAPGSKTAQLLEAVHAPLLDPQGQALEGDLQAAPLGIVIANDSDYKRANLLKHQASRFASPNLMVTNSDARFFPDLTVPFSQEASDTVSHEPLRYDRILCDVPCSGDGTVRKNVMIWRDWTFANGNGLHKLQLQILLRGLTLLADGGRLVYSTCSLNPIENEAVVAAALRAAPDQGLEVELVDTRTEPEFAQFASLVRYPGVTHWNVCPLKNIEQLRQAKRKRTNDMAKAAAAAAAAVSSDRASSSAAEPPYDAVLLPVAAEEPAAQQETTEDQPVNPTDETTLPWINSWDELVAELPDEADKIPQSFWPQGDEGQLNIPRCMRIYPHLQNTGGFFVAVFRKAGTNRSMAPGIVRGQDMLDASQAQKEEEDRVHPAKHAAPVADTSTEVPSKRPKLDDAGVAPASSEGNQEQQQAVSAEPDPVPQQDEEMQVDNPRKQDRLWLAERQEERAALGIRGDPSRLKEDAFTFVAPNQPEVAALQATYQFPTSWARNFLVRNAQAQPVRNIYFTTPVVRAIITGSQPYPPTETRHRWPQTVKVRLVYTGNRLFVRQGTEKQVRMPIERWRIPQDGEALIRPYLASERVVAGLSLVDLAYLIRSAFALVAAIPPSSLRSTAESMAIGSYILVFDPEHGTITLPPLPSPMKEGEDTASITTLEPVTTSDDPVVLPARLDSRLSVAVWKAPTSIVLMLDKKEKAALSLRLFGTDLSANVTDPSQSRHSRNEAHAHS